MSDIGGITPMRKLATYCEFYGVRTALHGPGKSRALYAVVHMGSFMHNKRPLKQLVTTATICHITMCVCVCARARACVCVCVCVRRRLLTSWDDGEFGYWPRRFKLWSTGVTSPHNRSDASPAHLHS